MKIGIISDTHDYLDEQIFDYFANCDEIWHAGDIGKLAIAEKLATFKPLKAVHGNIDDTIIRTYYPTHQHFSCNGLSVWITHIAGQPGNYAIAIKKILQQKKPHILVCGHTHLLRVTRDTKYQNLLYINPGAAGKYGIHTVRTLLRFTIKNKKPSHMEAIELGINHHPFK